MTVRRFLNYISYHNIVTPPEGVGEARWRGMLRWFATRKRLDEFLVPPPLNKEDKYMYPPGWQ